MQYSAALRMAIGLHQMPTQVRLMRKRPLPDGVISLLLIVAEDETAITQAVEVSGRPREIVHEASAFFIEQMLLHPEADSYRVLGARAEASSEELRRNMALLLRWLHPDVERQTGRSLFAHRVTQAWNDLKTKERRAAYDRARVRAEPRQTSKQLHASKKDRSRANMPPRPRRRGSSARSPANGPLTPYPRRMGLWQRLLLLIFGRVVR